MSSQPLDHIMKASLIDAILPSLQRYRAANLLEADSAYDNFILDSMRLCFDNLADNDAELESAAVAEHDATVATQNQQYNVVTRYLVAAANHHAPELRADAENDESYMTVEMLDFFLHRVFTRLRRKNLHLRSSGFRSAFDIEQATLDELFFICPDTEEHFTAIISTDRITSRKPVPEAVNPVNVASNLTSGIDNSLSTAADRVLKAIISFFEDASAVAKNAAPVHEIFSWIGFAVSFLYTITFAASYLYRKFVLKEEVIFGPRDVVRLVLSIAFLGLAIAGTFVVLEGLGPLFTLGFPIIAGISAAFSAAEHIYDYYKNKKKLKKINGDENINSHEDVIEALETERRLQTEINALISHAAFLKTALDNQLALENDNRDPAEIAAIQKDIADNNAALKQKTDELAKTTASIGKEARLKNDIANIMKKAALHKKLLDAAITVQDIPDFKLITDLRGLIIDDKKELDKKSAALEKLLSKKRGLEDSQIRLSDTTTKASTIIRSIVAVVTIVGAALVLVYPPVGLSIVAVCGVIGLVMFGVMLYNKWRLDKQIEADAHHKHADIPLSTIHSSNELIDEKLLGAGHSNAPDATHQPTAEPSIPASRNTSPSPFFPRISADNSKEKRQLISESSDEETGYDPLQLPNENPRDMGYALHI